MRQLVELTDVSKVYNGDRQHAALDSISICIEAGHVTAVMGPSGSGKSTLLNVIGGLDRPTGGSIVVDGVDLSRLNETALARFRRTRVGIVFQFFNLLNNLTALDNVTIPAQLAGIKPADARRRADDLLERLGIGAQRNHYPARLSGGQRQRIAIARALALSPRLIVCDEPVSALDLSTQARVLALFKEIQEGTGVSYLFISHDLAVVRHLSHRVAVMYRGEIVEWGDGDQVTAHPRHPYTQKLFLAAPVPDPVAQEKRRAERRRLQAALALNN